MVRQDGVFAQTLGQVVGHALRQAARVDEDQGGAMLADELGHAVVDLAPHFGAGHGAQLVARHFDGQVHGAPVADVDDRSAGRARNAATSSSGLTVAERPMRCGRAPAVLFHQAVQARQGQRQVRAALIVGDGVDFVHDHGADAAPASRAAWRR